MSDAGAVLFARYAYPPNELGHCGPDGAAALLDAGAPDEIGRRARGFHGAWTYLEFIARAAGLDDPLDEAVVRAYWLGGELLDRVPGAELADFLRARFGPVFAGPAVAHHAFQVFAVYPWLGLLRRTGHPSALTVLDRCRIRPGTVVAVDGEQAVVRCRPLVWDGGALAGGPVREERVSWSVGGRALLAGLGVGDRVALHWDWVCDRISAGEAAGLVAYEKRMVNF
ncbi:hypothetical protein GCM10010168_56680 [Actinoplanes ianthinogenes]|uniref:Uncharacterized protein n=1 Tax=Actinoplanes ianthinogenes TaxID=122358 RepID=A0ABM7M318_9ACTN|nr:DUF6390 family protein [Actinoplanes ianthinogenes]BCJ45912.1 hypothetical protein Aiant_65690 [Actinoplanes ianthinogenes]GGR31184.1 hypothetical protein GCM10010168_56680 [Actinoplanes ianthinogenes]